MRDLHQITKVSLVVISCDNAKFDHMGNIKLDEFPVPLQRAPAKAAPRQNTRDFLIALCNRQRVDTLAREGIAFDESWDNFMFMINGLYNLGYLSDSDIYHLYHGNLQLRNVFAVIVRDENAREKSEEEVLAVSEGLEKPHYREAFNAVVGSEFIKESDTAELVLARRMFHVVTHGIHSGLDEDNAKEIQDKFIALHTRDKE
ncbi:hypothetical protein BS50DRAFT_594449 [Corynespora cassiicola Philippines]|uniref:Uncharacterized protein n=1 Tax=Corynespora cassiicola Philippines TaxID=1448308 RepID=A0A2T2N2G6_CORCC|nr:hypothetical protein BS50DRAFT_594449 [Corynespora cassiicola Philippines]